MDRADVVDAEDRDAFAGKRKRRTDRGGRAVALGRDVVEELSNVRLAAVTKKNRAAEIEEPIRIAEKCQIVFQSLAESDTGIERDPISLDSKIFQRIATRS